MSVLEPANAAARFALELCTIAALMAWGFQASDAAIVGWVLGLGTPLAFTLIWGAFISPKSPYRLNDPARLVLEIAIFTATTIALATATSDVIALVFAAAVASNIGLMLLLGQRQVGICSPER